MSTVNVASTTSFFSDVILDDGASQQTFTNAL